MFAENRMALFPIAFPSPHKHAFPQSWCLPSLSQYNRAQSPPPPDGRTTVCMTKGTSQSMADDVWPRHELQLFQEFLGGDLCCSLRNQNQSSGARPCMPFPSTHVLAPGALKTLPGTFRTLLRSIAPWCGELCLIQGSRYVEADLASCNYSET